MIQREAQDAGAPFHFGLLPYPEQPISITPAYGGGLAPRKEFYESYDDQDIRKRNEEFFYTSKPKYGDPETTITLDVPYLCKYWDENAESTGKSGANIPVYRYADVLLMCAEAKATLDGGSTSDATAVDAYFQVQHMIQFLFQAFSAFYQTHFMKQPRCKPNNIACSIFGKYNNSIQYDRNNINCHPNPEQPLIMSQCLYHKRMVKQHHDRFHNHQCDLVNNRPK